MNTDSLIEMASAKVDKETDAMCHNAGMVSLGELQATLRGLHTTLKVVIRVDYPDGTIKFLHPDSDSELYCSYRGYYRYIALMVKEKDDDVITDWKLLRATEKVIGTTLTGYKGGEFRMTKFTPVWITKDYSAASGFGLVDIKIARDEGILTLVAKNIEGISSYA